jgi:voltage-gated potassium channel
MRPMSVDRDPSVSQPTFAELDRRTRRRLVTHSIARVVASTVILAVVYAWVPVPGARRGGSLVLLVLGLAVIGGVLAWQVKRILAADHPVLRAVEALAVAIPVVVVVFALVYLSLSDHSAANFSEQLDRVDACYFTVTVLATVGFGDIVARTHVARIAVTIQMLLDLALVAVVVRLFFGAAQSTIGGRRDPS